MTLVKNNKKCSVSIPVRALRYTGTAAATDRRRAAVFAVPRPPVGRRSTSNATPSQRERD
jgi:hypothetical protein